MHRMKPLARGAAALALIAGIGACRSSEFNGVVTPQFTGNNAIFKSYVALGNSITAGYQSGGITDSTQRQSYAFLLAQDMGTRFDYPSLAKPGCPPPYIDIFGDRPTGTTGTTCALRANTTATLNNVAVPGATSFDPIASSAVGTNALTSFILAGSSQVTRALQSRPTFATVWIGNNDVLGPATTGIIMNGATPLFTPPALFAANFDKTVDSLAQGAPGLKGVLIGVVQVAAAPIFVRGDTIFNNPAIQGAINQITGQTVTVLPNCATAAAGNSLIVLMPMLARIKAQQLPPFISCVANQPQAPIGDVLVLDSTEANTIAATVTAYNQHIQQKATSLGWAYYDPNPALALLRKHPNPLIPDYPIFSKPTAGYGAYISLDGVHPAAAAHKLIANALVTLINSTYQTTLQAIP